MHIFISYAKVDTYDLAIQLRDELRKIADVTVWMDETLEPGESWATQIQEEIDAADYLVVLLSPDVNRPVQGKQHRSFVLNEIDYARQVSKTIIPIMAKTTRVPVQIAGIQYIDFTGDQTAGLNRLIRKIAPRAGIPLSDLPPTPVAGTRLVDASALPPIYRRPTFIIGIITLVIFILVAIVLPNLNPPQPTITPTTNVALNPSATSVPTQPKIKSTSTITATPAPTLTATPSLEIAFIVQTLDAAATIQQATINAQLTDVARATAYAGGTQNVVDQTATAKRWTATPIPNITASIEAYRTQQGATATAQFVDGQTATATLWTFTPTPTITPIPIPLGFPGNPVLHNADWKPVYDSLADGIQISLVPAGCFMMGNTDGNEVAKPVNQQCFDKPFWIDRYEVTNNQYGSVGYFRGANLPRDSVTWIEARDFCSTRGARLPTESEWEYAARGPDNNIYPWGNIFAIGNAVFSPNSNSQSASAGSHIHGNSWVGANDLSGNVWEWVLSIYKSYPYKADDGRNDNSDILGIRRVVRGGSWMSGFGPAIRADYRESFISTYVSNTVGFRCARDY